MKKHDNLPLSVECAELYLPTAIRWMMAFSTRSLTIGLMFLSSSP